MLSKKYYKEAVASVAEGFSLTTLRVEACVNSKSRKANTIIVRQAVQYLLTRTIINNGALLRKTIPLADVGLFTKKKHTTIMNSIKAIEATLRHRGYKYHEETKKALSMYLRVESFNDIQGEPDYNYKEYLK